MVIEAVIVFVAWPLLREILVPNESYNPAKYSRIYKDLSPKTGFASRDLKWCLRHYYFESARFHKHAFKDLAKYT